MKYLDLDPAWPASWQYSYPYDLQEIYGRPTSRGYAYAYAERKRRTLGLLTVPLGSRVIDIAAAQGNFTLALAEMGYRVTWNDLRAELEGYVRLKQERGEVEFAPGNAFELDFPHLFDAVIATEIIEHVAHPDEFLRACARLARPGGEIIITTPNGAYFRNKLPKFSDCPDPSIFESSEFGPNAEDHIFLIWPDEIVTLADAAGLRVESVELFNNPLTSGHVKLEAALRALPRGIVEWIERCSARMPMRLRRKFSAQLAVRLRKPE